MRPNAIRNLVWLPAAVWAYLMVGRGRYWSASTPFPPMPAEGSGPWPAVAIVVPARRGGSTAGNAAHPVGPGLPGPVRVVLVDDMSSDGTAACAQALAERAPVPKLGLSVVTGKPRPPGWAGKPWAMAQGVEVALATAPAPEWLLFTDADIAHPPSCLHRLVGAARQDRRAAVSLMARLWTGTAWERLLMPAFVYFFARDLPVPVGQRQTAGHGGGGRWLLPGAGPRPGRRGRDRSHRRGLDR